MFLVLLLYFLLSFVGSYSHCALYLPRTCFLATLFVMQ